MKKQNVNKNNVLKKLLVILSALLFTGIPVLAQDATLSFPEVIAEPGTEVLLPLNITDLNSVGASSIYIQFDPDALTYIGIENSSFTGMLSNLVGDNEIRTSWFSLAPVNLTEKVYDVRFRYNGGTSDVIISFAQLTDALSEPYDIATVNGSIGDGLPTAELVLTSPNGGEQWLAGSTQNITWSSTEVTNVTIEFSTDAGKNWNTVVSSIPNSGTYEWTIPGTPTEQGQVRISDSENADVTDRSESNFTILPVLLPPVVGNIPDQTVEQCEGFEVISLDEYVSDGDDDKSALVWTSTGSVELLVDINKDRNAVVTIPNSGWSGSETITFTVTDPDGGTASDEVVFTVTEVNAPPEIVCPPNVTLELVSAEATYSGPSAEASDYCDAEPVVTSEPVLPVSYTEPGQYTITWIATDADGNSASCVQTITVVEQITKSTLAVDAGSDKTLSCGESVQIGGSPTAVDGKAPYAYLWTPAEGLDDPSSSNPAAGPSVTTTYTVKVTDAEGTVVSDEITVTVNDTEPPEIVCPVDVELEVTPFSSATYNGPSATASDKCDAEPVVTSEPALPVRYNKSGEYTITWTATDASGNSSSCSQRITVVESDDVPESNLALLSVTLSQLTDISTGDSKLDQKLDKAAEKLEKSLGQEYWQDENHLVEKSGKRVFDEGKKAVKDLLKICKDKNVDDAAELDIENVIENLLDVYYSLALISVQEDDKDCFDDKCADEIEKRYEELSKAEDELAKGKPDKAIDRYKKAWTKSKKKKKKNDRNESSKSTQSLVAETNVGYSLDQNYPNPFNPTTLISFSLSEAGAVRLVVYNTIGEEIEVLADGVYSSGYHTLQFNAENLTAGFYLYILETEKFVSVKKMLLIK